MRPSLIHRLQLPARQHLFIRAARWGEATVANVGKRRNAANGSRGDHSNAGQARDLHQAARHSELHVLQNSKVSPTLTQMCLCSLSVSQREPLYRRAIT